MRNKPPKKIGPEHLINRDLSWLAFNERLLEESLDATTPLLERVKFFCVFSANLDEFFETRVAGLKQHIESAASQRSPDGLTPTEAFQAINRRVRGLVARQYASWRNDLRIALADNGIRFLNFKDLSKADTQWVDEFYRGQVRPVLTPLGLDPAHPFPRLLNKSLNSIVQMDLSEKGERRRRLAVVQVPRVLPRLVKLPRRKSREQDYVFLGDLIAHYHANLFPGAEILGCWHFRVTRNTELYSDAEEAAALLKPVEAELRARRQGDAVRLEVEQGCPLEIRALLLENLGLAEDDLFIIDGPLNPIRLMAIAEGDHSPELRDPAFVAPVAADLREETDLFAAIRRGDVLLHHPYENFSSVVEFLRQAAADPKVLAIKQTLYRTGGDLPIFGALMEAARNGKQVTAVVELKGKSEEGSSAMWARRLEEAGVHVVYGLVGCRVHAKMCLVVRKDDDAIRRYLHLGTGNYNTSTAKYYTDVGLLTCRPEFGEDATNLFNLLTGICQFPGTKKLVVAPFELQARMLSLIDRETGQAKKGLPARIIAKMNALEDPEMIAALYRASQAGVKIDLIVRGICCLRPQVPGLSENITVRSIVDRFVEHSRILYFENACQPEVWVSSADWTPNHLFGRIEVAFPIDDGNLRERLRGLVLETLLHDSAKSRFLQASGDYTRPRPRRDVPPRRCQIEFLAAASARRDLGPVSSKVVSKYPRFKLAPDPIFSEAGITMLDTDLIEAREGAGVRLMVVLHGLGDSMEGYRWLPEALALPWMNYLLVNAPDPYYGGFAWYDLYAGAGSGIERSRKLLFELLDSAREKKFPSEQTVVLGFSQGCLMSLEIAARYPRRLAGIVGISGYAHEPETLAREMSPVARDQRILVTHGTLDPLIPIDQVRPQIQLLTRAGLKIHWHEFVKPHTIAGEQELAVIRDFVQSCYVQ